jgi:hypothetical protein
MLCCINSSFLLIAYLASAPKFETRNKMTTTIVDEVIDTPANYYTYYTFSVPAGASSARVTGTYEMHGGGLIPPIDIYLADTSLCSSLIVCKSYYYVGNDKSFEEVNVYYQQASEADKQLIICHFIILPRWARANRLKLRLN